MWVRRSVGWLPRPPQVQLGGKTCEHSSQHKRRRWCRLGARGGLPWPSSRSWPSSCPWPSTAACVHPRTRASGRRSWPSSLHGQLRLARSWIASPLACAWRRMRSRPMTPCPTPRTLVGCVQCLVCTVARGAGGVGRCALAERLAEARPGKFGRWGGCVGLVYVPPRFQECTLPASFEPVSPTPTPPLWCTPSLSRL